MAETVEITKDQYTFLQRQDRWLGYLEAAGVDNTSAYEYACDLAREDGFFEDEED